MTPGALRNRGETCAGPSWRTVWCPDKHAPSASSSTGRWYSPRNRTSLPATDTAASSFRSPSTSASTSCSASLRSGRYAYCSGCRSTSNIGSRISTAAICTMRSRIVGMPNGRCFPSGFGIHTRRTACGRYVLFLSSSASSPSHFCRPYSSMSSNVCPSTPARPGLPGSAPEHVRERRIDTPCHTTRRSDTWVLPSLWPATLLAAS